MDNILKEIMELRAEIEYHNRLYYELDSPAIDDFEYDVLLRRLEALENAHPQYMDENSPTRQIGGRAGAGFGKVTHTYPLQSLEDVFGKEELETALRKIHKTIGETNYVVEKKIDGLSVAIRYIQGHFTIAATGETEPSGKM